METGREPNLQIGLNDFDYGELYKVVSFGIGVGFSKEQILSEAEARLNNSLEWKILTKEKKLLLIDTIFNNKTEAIDEVISVETDLNFKPIVKCIAKQTSHLLFFDSFMEDFAIRVDNKNLLAKAYYYKYLSLLQQPRLSEIGGRVDSDNRLHILVMSPAGSGKGTLRHLETKFCRVNEVELPVASSSISNKEQMIGKVLRTGKGDNQQILKKKGYLGKKSLFYDESQDVLNEIKDKQHGEIMILNRSAMDSYGRNTITKELVDDRPEEVLNYYSPTSITFFAHPTQLTNVFFSRGTARRFSLFFEIEEDVKINVQRYTSLDFKVNTQPFEYFSRFKALQDSLKDDEMMNPCEYSEESCKIISAFTSSVLYMLLTHKNPKVVRYGILHRNVINLFFLKWINIIHLAKGKPYTDNVEVAMCLNDALGFFLNNIQNFIKRGNLDNQIPEWSELEEQYIWCLHYLLQKNATTLEKSSITIKQFNENVVGKIFGVHSRQAWKYYNELKSKGFIKSKQIGKHDSRVWLSRVPEDTILEDYDFTKTEGYEIMKRELLEDGNSDDFSKLLDVFEDLGVEDGKIADNLHKMLTTCKGCRILDTLPQDEKDKINKNITQLMLLLNNNKTNAIPYIHVRAFKFFFFFNIYKYRKNGGVSKSLQPLQPLTQNNNLSQKKQGNQQILGEIKENLVEKDILEYISENDTGNGCSVARLINDLNVEMIEIQPLFKRGDIYEIKAGYVKLI